MNESFLHSSIHWPRLNKRKDVNNDFKSKLNMWLVLSVLYASCKWWLSNPFHKEAGFEVLEWSGQTDISKGEATTSAWVLVIKSEFYSFPHTCRV